MASNWRFRSAACQRRSRWATVCGIPAGNVFVFGGKSWDDLGNPFGSLDVCNQIHSLGVYHGELYVGTWPLGKVAVRRNDKWFDVGRLGDATEIVGLTVYNGSLYGGSIPRAEVFRFDGPNKWASMGRLFDPPNFKLVPVGSYAKGIQDWTRASSLAVYDGKLFSSTATCYRAQIDPPSAADDIRGKVFCLQTGATVSADRDMGSGWRRIVASREGDALALFVDGKLAARSQNAQPESIFRLTHRCRLDSVHSRVFTAKFATFAFIIER